MQKLKGQKAKARLFSKFTKRWFCLDLKLGTFTYYRKKESTKAEVSHSILEIVAIDPNPRVTQICDWKFVFMVETKVRVYILYSESVNMHNLWCVALRAVLLPLDRYRPTNDPNQAVEVETAQNTPQYPDDRYQPEPPGVYNDKLTQNREDASFNKQTTKNGFKRLEDFPSHPSEIDYQPRSQSIAVPNDYRPQIEQNRPNYQERPLELRNQVDRGYADQKVHYNSPQNEGYKEEVNYFKPPAEIRENPNQIKRERISEIVPTPISYVEKIEVLQAPRGVAYSSPPKDNYTRPNGVIEAIEDIDQFENPQLRQGSRNNT